jgi:endogenous inhibitor of DNA gyrase (YacG/DUF329 family)
MNVDCPQCSKKVVWDRNNPYRPFCSDRCKKMDLGAWAEERYVIASPAPEPDEHPEEKN